MVLDGTWERLRHGSLLIALVVRTHNSAYATCQRYPPRGGHLCHHFGLFPRAPGDLPAAPGTRTRQFQLRIALNMWALHAGGFCPTCDTKKTQHQKHH